MTAITMFAAVEEMATQFLTPWQQDGRTAEYPNFSFAAPPTKEDTWARLEISHSNRGQASLANHGGKRRWRSVGTLAAELKVPIGKGTQLAYELAQLIVDAFEGQSTPSGVEFKNVRPQEYGKDGLWYRIDVIADFEYDQIK